MDLEEIKKIIEIELIKLIVRYLRSGKLKLEESRKNAREYLALLPFRDKADMQVKLMHFAEKYNDFKPIYLTFLKIEEEEKTADLVERMRGLMRQNKIDEALSLVI